MRDYTGKWHEKVGVNGGFEFGLPSVPGFGDMLR